ncbi:Ycf66 family protein [Prochlorococcus marinus]|uniref:Uncharacterized protein n=1 Tax=Prochlorococcus marinus (strain MIT 9211) TaxID=93059 RepID=A9BDK5_PROM4|nr:Ycf66 family protein [Prochlorococcus marinus]ABX08191.1 conserved hypothetical protein [Prochlorococcus marinus str. MIT 9211]
MLAVFIGDLSVLVGFVILILPLVLTELSRARDSLWGALVIILGLILITENDRFTGTPMLAVLLGALIISRLLLEVSNNRWQQLSPEEKIALKSFQKWNISIRQLFLIFAKLWSICLELIKALLPKKQTNSTVKKWIRPDPSAESKTLTPKEFFSDETSPSDLKTDPDQNSSLKKSNFTSEDS